MDQTAFSALKKWLGANGGDFHENVRFQQAGISQSATTANNNNQR
jgi:hypothetical protein